MIEHDMVDHPVHYTSHSSGVEVITYSRLLPFGPGSAVKYVMRRDLKGDPVENLSKAIWFLTDSIDNHISYSITLTMHHAVHPVIEAEPNAIVKAFLAALYCHIPGRWLFGNYPDLELARDLVGALQEEYE